MEAINIPPNPKESSTKINILVVVFTLKDEKLMVLVQRSEIKSSNEWSLPAAHLPENVSLESAAASCIADFSGSGEVYLEQLYTYGDPQRHPKYRLVSVVYFALVPAGADGGIKTEFTTRWFEIDHLPSLVMDHTDIITYAIRRLRYKLEYTAVGFQLLPEVFTLSELQKTYELILGVKLDKRNFRRRILQASIIEGLPGRRLGEGRPAQLFRYRPDAVAEVKARRLFP